MFTYYERNICYRNIKPCRILLLGSPRVIHSQSSQIIEVRKFSVENPRDTLSSNWKPLTVKKIEKHTQYQLVKDGDTTVVLS